MTGPRTTTGNPQRTLVGPVRRVVAGNPWRYDPQDYSEGRSAEVPIYPRLILSTIHPKILYHYTKLDALGSILLSVGMFPATPDSEKPFVFLTAQSSWKIELSTDRYILKFFSAFLSALFL